MIKIIFFDFNGTIADTGNATILIYDELRKKYKLNELSPDELIALKSRSALYYSWKLGIRPWNFMKIKRDSASIVSSIIAKANIFPGIEDTLLKLAEKKIKLCIVSSNANGDIIQFLARHHLEFFSDIYGNITLNKKHKIIEKILSDFQLLPHEALFIGDEMRDYESSQKAKVPFVLARWGHPDHNKLSFNSPIMINDSPLEILLHVDQCSNTR